MSGALRAFLICLIVAFAVPANAAESEILVGARGAMHATLVTPDGPGPYPGVLVLHTSGGLEEADLAFARELAGEGYVALVPAFMEAYGLTAQTRAETFTRDGDAVFADLTSALATLSANPKVRGAKLGAVGFSNGGYFAVWLALAGKVQAGVSYYGALSGAGTDREERRFAQALGKASSPVLILHGLDDTTVPVGEARRLAGLLGGAGVPYEMQLYPQTGHLFDRGGFNPSARGGKTVFVAGAGSGDEAAQADAWTRTLDFFSKYLK